MPKFQLCPTKDAIVLEHIEVNEKIGRISVDGHVNGVYTAVVFTENDLPRGCNTMSKQKMFIEDLMRKTIESEENKERE